MADESEPQEDGVTHYLNIISSYENEFKKWEGRTNKVIKRYRDDQDSSYKANSAAKFNILWSNVQTLIPAVYAKLPKADVSRRHGDNDQVGRVAALLVERALDFEVEHYPDFRQAMRYCVEDRFLGGRGVAWVRYEPHVRAQETGEPEDGLSVTTDQDEPENEVAPLADAESQVAGDEAPPEEIDYECSPTDYVHWRDFGHNIARTWDEVTVVWRWVYLGKEAVAERFGEDMAKTVSYDASPQPLNRNAKDSEHTKAKICELWDKERGRVYWIQKTHIGFLDERPDPLNLEGFFPCPRPLYATLTSDNLIPVPDFTLYQDQAEELDILSDRIDGLVKALKVRGVYDASVPALQRLLTEGDNNTLIPVNTWAAFSEKGGLAGAVDLLPLDMLAKALLECYKARADIKGQIYEITGISDIIRGQTEAQETATAQQIKGRYAGLRLRSMQEDVAMFATEILRTMAQIICSKYQPETILQYAAAQQLTPEDQQLIPQALELLKNRVLRNFRIEVAADSLVQIDEEEEKQGRIDFLTAVGGFMGNVMPVIEQAPQLLPMVAQLLKFGIGGFKRARTIEGVLDAQIEKLEQAQKEAEANPQPPPPDPEVIKIEAQKEIEGMKQQGEDKRHSATIAVENRKIDAGLFTKRMELGVKREEGEMNRRHDDVQGDKGREFEGAEAEKGREEADKDRAMAEPDGDEAPAPAMPTAEQMGQFVQALQGIAAQMQQANRPKKVVRGPDGLVQEIV